MSELTNKLSDDAKHELWRRGHVPWKMNSPQKQVFEIILKEWASKHKRTEIVVDWYRGAGKTSGMFLFFVVLCLRTPGLQCFFSAQFLKDADEILAPILPLIFDDCPPDLIPRFDKANGAWTFYNGARITMHGAQAGSKSPKRGRKFDVIGVDEAGFQKDLLERYQSVYLPRIAKDGGLILWCSTVPETPLHFFKTKVDEAKKDGKYFTLTLADDPSVSKERFLEIANAYPGGIENTTFRREFMCEYITDEQVAILPELSRNPSRMMVFEKAPYKVTDPFLAERAFTKEVHIYFDLLNETAVVACTKSPLYGIHIVKEKLIKQPSSKMIAEAVKEVLQSFPDDAGMVPCFSNGDKELLKGLAVHYGTPVMYVKEPALDVMVGAMRSAVSEARLIVHPLCSTTIAEIQGGILDETMKDLMAIRKNYRFNMAKAVMLACLRMPPAMTYQAWSAAEYQDMVYSRKLYE